MLQRRGLEEAMGIGRDWGCSYCHQEQQYILLIVGSKINFGNLVSNFYSKIDTRESDVN